MSRHEDTVRLRHMLDHAREAVDMAADYSREDLEAERWLNLALVRLIEIVGEAANRVTQSQRNRAPEVPWLAIIGTRNRLVHGYDEIDFDLLWKIVREDLPALVLQLESIVDNEST